MHEIVYDRAAVGERIRTRRKELNLTQEQLADQIGRIPKYCADIERGSCGMSIETMLGFCNVLKMSPSMLLLGEALPEMFVIGEDAQLDRQIMTVLAECTAEQKMGILQIARLFTQRK